MKKIIMPIVMAATLTVHAANNPDLPFNAYDRFVIYASEFNNCFGQELFTTPIGNNNYERTFKWIERKLNYNFFIDVVVLSKNQGRNDNYNNLCMDILEQEEITRKAVSVDSV
ncbi:MAG: hypothetical protein FADNKDHG_01435 [Holosporales bacterium]